jgi:putative ABC transport system permease protein
MKYLNYIIRNARRNPVRSVLTIASMAICLFLTMALVSFFAVFDEAFSTIKIYNRVMTLNSNGFAGMIPIARVKEVGELEGVVAATPFSWFGGKYHDEIMPFAQFAVDADSIMTILDEFSMPAEQIKAFKETKDSCIIGRKLAAERSLRVGDSLPLKGDSFPIDLDLKIAGIYDGPSNRDLRMCLFHFDSFDEKLKRVAGGRSRRSTTGTAPDAGISGNAAAIYVKCKDSNAMAAVCKRIDELYKNSEYPTRTQTEEAFGKMFGEMFGDLKNAIYWIGAAVVVALIFVAGNAMAMAMRERTTEVAVLKAIGFSRARVLFLVMAEAILVAGIGGAVGAFGCKALFDFYDISPYTAGFLPFFYVPWSVAWAGLSVSLLIGFLSGVFPAIFAANASVIDGLRKVV